MRHFPVTLLVVLSTAGCIPAQPGAPVKLNLHDAEALALQNHPQVLAAQHAVSAMNQKIDETRAAYYPALSGDVTGSQANPRARIGAGYLTDPSLYNRVGQGISLSQLITDSGRTSNLVASSRLEAGAAGQTAQATRYDVLVRVNQAYFGTLRAQGLVKVAQETVAARQLLVDQVTALFNHKLRSELDVSFVDVNLSQAKLLLLQSQDDRNSNSEWRIVQGSAAGSALPGSRSRPAVAGRGGSHRARREDGLGHFHRSLPASRRHRRVAA